MPRDLLGEGGAREGGFGFLLQVKVAISPGNTNHKSVMARGVPLHKIGCGMNVDNLKKITIRDKGHDCSLKLCTYVHPRIV